MERTLKSRQHSRRKSSSQPKQTRTLMSRASSFQYDISQKARLMVQRVSFNSVHNLSPTRTELETKFTQQTKNFLVPCKSNEDIKALRDLKLAFKLPNVEKKESKIKIPRSKSPLTKLGIENKSFVINADRNKELITRPNRRASVIRMPGSSNKVHAPSTLGYNKGYDIPKTVSKHTYRSRTGSVRGTTKRFNQDAHFIHENYANIRNLYIFGVLDGHGTYGHNVSHLLKESIPSFIQNELISASN